MITARSFGLVVCGVFAVSHAGCSPEKALKAANTGSVASSAPPASASASASSAPALPAPPIGRMDFAENDFVESDRNRDPFRSYVAPSRPPRLGFLLWPR